MILPLLLLAAAAVSHSPSLRVSYGNASVDLPVCESTQTLLVGCYSLNSDGTVSVTMVGEKEPISLDLGKDAYLVQDGGGGGTSANAVGDPAQNGSASAFVGSSGVVTVSSIPPSYTHLIMHAVVNPGTTSAQDVILDVYDQEVVQTDTPGPAKGDLPGTDGITYYGGHRNDPAKEDEGFCPIKGQVLTYWTEWGLVTMTCPGVDQRWEMSLNPINLGEGLTLQGPETSVTPYVTTVPYQGTIIGIPQGEAGGLNGTSCPSNIGCSVTMSPDQFLAPEKPIHQ